MSRCPRHVWPLHESSSDSRSWKALSSNPADGPLARTLHEVSSPWQNHDNVTTRQYGQPSLCGGRHASSPSKSGLAPYELDTDCWYRTDQQTAVGTSIKDRYPCREGSFTVVPSTYVILVYVRAVGGQVTFLCEATFQGAGC